MTGCHMSKNEKLSCDDTRGPLPCKGGNAKRRSGASNHTHASSTRTFVGNYTWDLFNAAAKSWRRCDQQTSSDDSSFYLRYPKIGSPSLKNPYRGLNTHGSVNKPESAATSAGARCNSSLKKKVVASRARPKAPWTKYTAMIARMSHVSVIPCQAPTGDTMEARTTG